MTEAVGRDVDETVMHAHDISLHARARAAIAPCGPRRTYSSMSEHTTEPTTRRTRKGRPTVDELRQRTLPLDRLWTIEDVAAFLACSVREAEDIVKDPGVPQPRLSRGRLRRWSPIHWHDWLAGTDELHVPNTAGNGDDNNDDDDDTPELGAA